MPAMPDNSYFRKHRNRSSLLRQNDSFTLRANALKTDALVELISNLLVLQA